MTSPRALSPLWTFAIVSVALFMVVLDNLVVTTALPSIRADLGGGLQALEWTVNAYTLTFAVLLLTGAALGDRFGRRRMFVIGLGIFTVASALAALAPTTGALIAARALQGAGAAIVTPLTLTLLSTAFPAEKRGLAIGAWSGISGLGVALGPLIGGAVVDGISWHWIFWLNVPIGHRAGAARATAAWPSRYGPAGQLDLPGLALGGLGLLGHRLRHRPRRRARLDLHHRARLADRRRACPRRASSPGSCARRAPMLPMRFFRSRAFAASNGVSFAMYFGVFGSIFLLAQFFQVTQGLSPLEAGLRTLPWTAMPMFVAPIAGLLSDRIGSRPLMADRPGAAGDRDRLAGRRLDADRALLRARDPVHPRRHRHGARVRADGQRRAQRRPPGGGRPGLGRDERDPRGRRHARRRRAGLGVRRQRLLRVAAGVHRRHDERRVGRCRRARRGRAGRAARPGQAPREPAQVGEPALAAS